MSQYIELHSRSAFSFLEGSSLPENLIARCAELKMPAMALLDRDGVYGAPRFHMSAKKAGIKAHIGAEVACNFVQRSRARTPAPPNPICYGGTGVLARANEDHQFRLPLLVSCRIGYQNLCRLITKMKLRAAKDEGTVCKEELQEYSAGLICLTGGDSGPLSLAFK